MTSWNNLNPSVKVSLYIMSQSRLFVLAALLYMIARIYPSLPYVAKSCRLSQWSFDIPSSERLCWVVRGLAQQLAWSSILPRVEYL